jgi:hypothetical protein
VFQLLQLLRQRGFLDDVVLVKDEREGVGAGRYDPETKRLAVIAYSSNEGDRSVIHEVIHNVLQTGESRTRKMAQQYKELGFLNKLGIVFPKHWTEGKMANPYHERVEGTASVPTPQGRISQFAGDALNRRVANVRDSIEKGTRWSGLRSSSEGSPWTTRGQGEEALAYHLTSPRVKTPLDERKKELGMFLMDHYVPDDIAIGVMDAVGAGTVPQRTWGGGSYETGELLREIAENRQSPLFKAHQEQQRALAR